MSKSMAPSTTSSTATAKPRKKRRPQRRDEILDAAVELFRRNGYHATGIDEIGATAGVTGPAIYRHFKSKEDILETLLVAASGELLASAEQLAAEAATPAEALRSLVEFAAETLLSNPALSYVAHYERRTLPDESQTALDRAERLYLEAWVKPLAQVRPELSDAEARVIVQATAGLAVAATTFKSGLDRKATKDLIVAMMMNALMVPGRAIAKQRRTRRAS